MLKIVYVYTETKNKNNYKYTIITPEKNNARISIGKTIRKRPQNKLARRVARRKEERKERKSLLAVMVRRFFYLWRKIVRKEACAQNIPRQNLYMFIPNKKPE